MRFAISLLVLIAGIVFLIFGVNASRSLASGISQNLSGAPSGKGLIYIVIGVLCLLYGGVGTIFNRK